MAVARMLLLVAAAALLTRLRLEWNIITTIDF